MDSALNNLQRLICHVTQPTNSPEVTLSKPCPGYLVCIITSLMLEVSVQMFSSHFTFLVLVVFLFTFMFLLLLLATAISFCSFNCTFRVLVLLRQRNLPYLYLPDPSARAGYDTSQFYAEFNRFEFRVFLLLD